MESFWQWMQDWQNACVYAGECTPDLSFFLPPEPYSALASIAGACFAVWWWNNRKLRQLLIREARVAKAEGIPAVRTEQLSAILALATAATLASKHQAA